MLAPTEAHAPVLVQVRRAPLRLLKLRAIALLPVLDLGLYWFGFARTYALLLHRATAAKRRGTAPRQAATVTSVCAAVENATRYYYRRRRKDCLPKALLTYYLLNASGVQASVHLGVRKFPFGAHAWVENDGQLVNDTQQRVGMYTPLMKG